ncbi:MAG: exodeoxyribonuclease VII large subunit [Oscillospiraceae bacterium]
MFASAIPVVSAVGHETDVSIADYVADRRAPTPSAAAEIVSPDAARLAEALAGSEAALRALVWARLHDYAENLQRLSAKPCMADEVYTIIEKKEALLALRERLENGVYTITDAKNGALSHTAALLDAFSPFKILARGYAIAQKDGEALTDAGRLAVGETVRVLLDKGAFHAQVRRIETEAGPGRREGDSRAGLAGEGGVPDGGEKDV